MTLDDRIEVKIGKSTVTYGARVIDAPKEYDGFGTLTVSESSGRRLVLIQEQHLDWQVGRYASGRHMNDEVTLGYFNQKDVEDRLWKKVVA